MAINNDFNFGVGFNNSTVDGSSFLTDDILKKLSGIDGLLTGGNITPTQNFGLNNQLGNQPSFDLGNKIPQLGGTEPSLINKLFGGKGNLGALTGGASVLKDLAGIYGIKQQVQLGKDQIQTEKNIFNNNQRSLQEASARTASNLLNSSPFAKGFSQAQKDDFLKNQTSTAKFI